MIICPSCSAEVSPYVTECPYCGKRVQKRAPKLGTAKPPKQKKKRERKPRRGVPSIELSDGRLLAVPALVAGSVVLSVLIRAGVVQSTTVGVIGHVNGDWAKLLTAPFAHPSVAYGFVVLVAFAIFGSRIEKRFKSGALVVITIWLVSGALGAALTAETLISFAAGALAPAIAVTVACGMGAVEQRRDGGEADLAGPGVVLAVLLVMPPLVVGATWMEVLAGLIVGVGAGTAVVRSDRRR
jgi:membrane associated rhomboid family serine protease